MEPVTSIMSGIFKVLQAIAKAEREARRNRARCRDLAERAQVVSSVLRDVRTAGRNNNEATRKIVLCRLREALDDALKLVESCGHRDGRLLSKFAAFFASGARAGRFNDVDTRISNCLVELNAASIVSTEKKVDRLAVTPRDHHQRTNKPKGTKTGNAPQNGATGQGGQNGGKGGKRRRGKNKAAAAGRPPPPPSLAYAGVRFHQNGHGCTAHHHHHYVEEDPNSCTVM